MAWQGSVESGVVNCGRGCSERAAGEQVGLYGSFSSDTFICIPPAIGIESGNMQWAVWRWGGGDAQLLMPIVPPWFPIVQTG